MKYNYIGPEEFLTECKYLDGSILPWCEDGSCLGKVMGKCPFTHTGVPFPEFDMFFEEVHE